MTHVELRQRALQRLAEARKIREDAGGEENLTDEQLEQILALTGEAEKLEERAAAMQRLEDTEARFERAPGRRSIAAASGGATGTVEKTIADATRTVVESVRENVLDDPMRGFGPELRESMAPRERRRAIEAGYGEFAIAVIAAENGDLDERLLPLRRRQGRERSAAATGMSQGVGADGGFLLPPEFSALIWDGLNSGIDAILPMTEQFTVEGESLTFMANAETSRANGSRYGGIQGFWIAEAGTITPSQPRLRRVTIEPQQLAVAVWVTDKLLNNAPIALGQFLTRASRDEINFKVGDAIFNGTGVGQPLGILSSGATVTISRAAQGVDTFLFANVVNMWARLHARARANAVWFINQDVEPQLNQMAFDPAATSKTPVYLPQNQVVNSPFAQLFGRPVIPVEWASTLGDVGDVILADMQGYTTGTRGSVQEAFSMHVRFLNAESVFRFMFEVDGRPWLKTPLTPFKGTNTLSHFVTAATATDP